MPQTATKQKKARLGCVRSLHLHEPSCTHLIVETSIANGGVGKALGGATLPYHAFSLTNAVVGGGNLALPKQADASTLSRG